MTHDIDWFGYDCGLFIHFASNGSMLPIIPDAHALRIIQRKVNDIKEIYSDDDLEINQEYVTAYREQFNRYRDLFPNQDFDIGWCLSSFKSFARKGFISCDWDKECKQYIWVARPRFPHELQIDLPQLSDDFICENSKMFRAIGLGKRVYRCCKKE